MSRRPSGKETRTHTISYRVTASYYRKVMQHVDKAPDVDLSEYARNALISRIETEDKDNADRKYRES